ncbi:MAG TPA: phosphatase PAP2 family protein [Prevotella sp.]
MANLLIDLFKIDTKPKRGILAFEWVVLAYMAFTLLVVLFAYTRLENPEAMVWGRLRVGAMTIALWGVYRLLPCKFTLFARVLLQMALLAWWYPDTYEINRLFPNLDHVFAQWEQSLFGFQPALVFAGSFPSVVMSELMHLGYASYYPMIAVVTFFFFFRRYADFERCAFVILASFFAYYVVFDLLPVAGPTFYYKAVGLDQIAKGVFPNVHDYFATHQDCLTTPGYANGLFYHLVEDAKAAGERPTAAFPSSHVGIATVCMLLVWHARNRRLLLLLLPLYLLLCFSTVYIQAHYAIDALAGLLSGMVFYFVFMRLYRP